MEYTTLGKTSIKISRITHGCMELGGGPDAGTVWAVQPEEQNIELLNLALSHGVNCFDTAESYGQGRSERIVGKALKNVRNQCVIASKVSAVNLAPDSLERSLEQSLKRLDTTYIDLYYMHQPNDSIPIEKTMGKLNQFKEQGLIRAIGASNFSVAQLEAALEFGVIDAVQPEYNLLSRGIEHNVLSFCHEHQISVMTYNSVAKGILTGAFHLYGAQLDAVDFRNKKPLFQPASMECEKELILLLEAIAKLHQVSITEVAIAWSLRQPGVSSTVVGTQNPKHFAANLNAVDLLLTDEEQEKISALSTKTISELQQRGLIYT